MDPISLAIMGGFALVVGIAHVVDYISDNKKAIDELEYAQKDLETQYNDQKDILSEQKLQADESADLAYEQSKAKKELELKQANETLDNTYNQNKKNTDLDFEINKKEAFHNADVSDKEQTFNEWVYSNELNNQLDLLNKSQKLTADNYNQASISIGQNTGNALSAAAASGTRTSSMNQAIDLEQAANYQTLQLNQDYNRAGVANSYQSLLLQGAQQNFNIQQNRDAANYLRNSYLEGGSNYRLYQNALADLQTNYELSKSQLKESGELDLSQMYANYDQTKYQTQTMYQLRNRQLGNDYTSAYNKLQRQLDDRRDINKTNLRATTAFLTGAKSGWDTGNGLTTSYNNYFAK